MEIILRNIENENAIACGTNEGCWTGRKYGLVDDSDDTVVIEVNFNENKIRFQSDKNKDKK